MPELLLYFSTAAVWLLLAAMAWRGARPALVAGGPAAREDVRFETVLVPVALVLNGMLLYRSVVHVDGLDLSVGNGVAMLVWLTVLIYWVAGLAYDGLRGMLGLMSPLALAAVLLQAVLKCLICFYILAPPRSGSCSPPWRGALRARRWSPGARPRARTCGSRRSSCPWRWS